MVCDIVVLNGTHSTWCDVKSGVPQGSVLGPLLFIIYLNDIDIGLQNNIYKFADDSKIAGRVSDVNGSIALQQDLDKLISWADRWQMEFNIDKCKVVHAGRNNRNFTYEMQGQWLESSHSERNLGVIIP